MKAVFNPGSLEPIIKLKTVDLFYKAINAGIISIYCFLIAVVIFYHIVATYSHTSVYDTFGPIPGNDALYELAVKKDLQINTFPVDCGYNLIMTWFCLFYIIPVLIVVNYFIYRSNKKIKFQKYWSIALLCCYLGSWGLMSSDKFGGWYFQYVLD